MLDSGCGAGLSALLQVCIASHPIHFAAVCVLNEKVATVVISSSSKKGNVYLLFELIDYATDDFKSMPEGGWHRIAWGFLKLVSKNQGKPKVCIIRARYARLSLMLFSVSTQLFASCTG